MLSERRHSSDHIVESTDGWCPEQTIYKSESKLVVAYGCGVEWECGRVTDYMNTRFLWGHDED